MIFSSKNKMKMYIQAKKKNGQRLSKGARAIATMVMGVVSVYNSARDSLH